MRVYAVIGIHTLTANLVKKEKDVRILSPE